MRWRRSTRVEGYTSEDGAWTIERQEPLTSCENPHPMGRGRPRCEGGEEHAYVLWVLWRDDPGGDRSERVDAGSTLREMKDVVEQETARPPHQGASTTDL